MILNLFIITFKNSEAVAPENFQLHVPGNDNIILSIIPMFTFKTVVRMIRLWFCGHLYMIVYLFRQFKVIVPATLFKDLIHTVCEGCGIKTK